MTLPPPVLVNVKEALTPAVHGVVETNTVFDTLAVHVVTLADGLVRYKVTVYVPFAT